MGVEIKERPVTDDQLAEMKQFVYEYLKASVEREHEGGRMRWYPWHSADYRFNHIQNVIALGTEIARKEGADVDVTRVAAVFHDVAKLEVDQEVHAEEGARIAREYLSTHEEFPASFVDAVCRAIRQHSYQGPLQDLALETQALVEADILDKVGANGVTLMLLRMGYESRTHTDAAEMIDRVVERGNEAIERVETDTGETIAHKRLKRARWIREWLTDEIAAIEPRV